MNIQEFTTVVKSDSDWTVYFRIVSNRGSNAVWVDAMHKFGGTIYLSDFTFNSDPQTVKRCLDSHGLAFELRCDNPALLAELGLTSGDPKQEQPAEQPTLPKKKCEVCGKSRYHFKSGRNCVNFIENPHTRRWQCQVLGYGNAVFTPAESVKALFTGGKL